MNSQQITEATKANQKGTNTEGNQDDKAKSEAFFLARRAEAIFLDSMRAHTETHIGEPPSGDQVAKLAEEAFRAAKIFAAVAAHPSHIYERKRLSPT